MESIVVSRYEAWEKSVRNFIRVAEEARHLGAVEVAKSLLLYGMKLYEDLLASALSEHDRVSFIDEMSRRTDVVLKHVSNKF